MRAALPLLAVSLALGCAQVSGLDDYCPLENGSPFDAPCRLVAPSCGCPEGSACRLDDRGIRSCEATFSRTLIAPGGDCFRSSDCVGGATCSFGICRAFCEFAEDCAPMGPFSRCVRSGSGIGACTRSCRPLSGECGSGFNCGTIDGGTACLTAGSGSFGQACSEDALCGIGLQCVAGEGEPATCKAICGPGLSSCLAEETCTRVEGEGPLGTDQFGVCAL